MEKLLRLISDIYYSLFGGTSLLQHERLCLDAWRDCLSSHAKQILDAQLSGPIFVQRGAGGAKVCFFIKKQLFEQEFQPPLFEDRRPDLHTATVVLNAEKGKQMNAKIFVHRGRFFSIEFPKRPKRYMQRHQMTGLLLKATEVKIHVKL